MGLSVLLGLSRQLCNHLLTVAEAPDTCAPEALMVLLSCLVGLRPDVLDTQDARSLLNVCIALLHMPWPDIGHLATAIGSLINKMPDSEDFVSFTLGICTDALLPAIAVDKKLVICLGTVLRAVGMRGKARLVESMLVEKILKLNKDVDAASEAIGPTDWKMASLLELAIKSGGDAASACFLDKKMHARAGKLWRQRMFTTLLHQLLEALAQDVQDAQREHRMLLALAFLLRGAGIGRVKQRKIKFPPYIKTMMCLPVFLLMP